MPGIWTSRGSSSTARRGWVAADALNAVAGSRGRAWNALTELDNLVIPNRTSGSTRRSLIRAQGRTS
jgi:hypothetical protein